MHAWFLLPLLCGLLLPVAVSRAAVSTTIVQGQFTVTSDAASDLMELGVQSGFLRLLVNGVVNPISGTVAITNVHTIVVNGNSGEDTLRLDHSGGLMAVTNGITYLAGGGTNRLVLLNDPALPPIGRQTYFNGPALGLDAEDGLVVFDPNDSLGPGLFGSYDGDEEIVRFFAVADFADVVPAPELDVFLSPVADFACIADGPPAEGLPTTRVSDPSGGVCGPASFGNKPSIRVNGVGGADTFRLDHTNPPPTLTSIQLYGTDVGEGFVFPEDDAADLFLLRHLGGSVQLHVWGQGGDDSFEVGSSAGTLDGLDTLDIDGAAGFDTMDLSDQENAAGSLYRCDSNQALRIGGVAVSYAGVEALSLATGSGDDEVWLMPSGETLFGLDGGPESAGDLLVVDGHLFPFHLSAGLMQADGLEPVTHSDFEQVKLTNSPADLAIACADSPDPVEDGRFLRYTVTVSNQGPGDATGVVVSNTTPSLTELLSATPAGSVAGAVLTVPFGVLASGEVAQVVLDLHVLNHAGRSLTNRVGFVFDGVDPIPMDDLAEVTGVRKHILGDFDGDGLADPAVFLRSLFEWSVLSGGVTNREQLGYGQVLPVPADYDGDGEMDLACYDPENGAWSVLRSSDGSLLFQQWGWPGAVAIPADYDGDGQADFTVYDPASENWYILQTKNGVPFIANHGGPEAIPAPADFDADGETDMTVFLPASGRWRILQSIDDTVREEVFGWSRALPVPADYDFDGAGDLAVYDPDAGLWLINLSGGGYQFIQFGGSGMIPVPGDYDGDGPADPAVFQGEAATWFLRQSSAGVESLIFGPSGGEPVP